MSAMYEAMKKAAEKNPEFAETLDQAVKANKDRIKKEAAEQRVRASAAYQAKIAQEQREAQEKEAKRRKQELDILGNPRMYPFGYVYQDSGPYSVTYGIIFALTSTDAREAIVEMIKKNYEEDTGYKSSYDEEYHYRALKSVCVWQLDLSEGRCGIGGYTE